MLRPQRSLFSLGNWSTRGRAGAKLTGLHSWYLVFLSRLLAYFASPVCKTLKLTLSLFGGRTDRLVDHHWLSRFWTLRSSQPGFAPFDRECCLVWRLSLQSLFPQSWQTDQIWPYGRFLIWPHRVWSGWSRAGDFLSVRWSISDHRYPSSCFEAILVASLGLLLI